MKPRELSLALAVGCALAMSAVAQTTTDMQSKAGATTSAASLAATNNPSAATNNPSQSTTTTTDTANQRSGASISSSTSVTGAVSGSVTGTGEAVTTTTPGTAASSTISGTTTTTDTVLVPGAVVVAPGITVLDSTTTATVGSTISDSDRELLEALVSALSSDPALRGAHLNVTVNGDLVRIIGTAIDTAQADRARSVAASVASNARVEADIATG